jgi:hypothetical protein
MKSVVRSYIDESHRVLRAAEVARWHFFGRPAGILSSIRESITHKDTWRGYEFTLPEITTAAERRDLKSFMRIMCLRNRGDSPYEQALETANLMLGSEKSRGYCLEMICADFLAKRPRLHLDSNAFQMLRLSMLTRDLGRCQSCGSRAGLEVHHIMQHAAQQAWQRCCRKSHHFVLGMPSTDAFKMMQLGKLVAGARIHFDVGDHRAGQYRTPSNPWFDDRTYTSVRSAWTGIARAGWSAQRSVSSTTLASYDNCSEYQFQSQLNLAGSAGCGHDFARRRTDVAAGKNIRVRQTEVGSVSDIKKFGPK